MRGDYAESSPESWVVVNCIGPYGREVTIRGRHRLAASMLLASMGTACGGGAGTNSAAGRSTAPRSAPASTTTTATTAARKVIDRGDDYVAIARSLLLFDRWFERRRTGAHVVEVDRAPMDLAVISVMRNVVSLRVTEHLARREAIAADGRILARDRARNELHMISIARSTSAAAWRVNLNEPMRAIAEVQLGFAANVVAPNSSAGDADGSGELHNGRFSVGVEYDAPGSDPVTFDAGDRSLPRLFHYVSTPLISDDHTPGSLENLCNAGAGAGPAGVVFGWLYRVIAYTADGRIVSDTHVCVPFPDQNDRSVPPPPPTLPEPPTIGEVWRAIQLPNPIVGVSPVSRGVTGLATRLWSGGAQTAQVAATIDGFAVTGTARVVEYRFATDEGYLGAGGPGSAQAPAFTHEFTTKGAHTLLVSSVWRATVVMTGPGVTIPIPIDINVAVLTAVADYPVTEVRSRLVG